MEPIIVHTGKPAVLNRVNVDTDQIIPKQFLKRVERTGFGQYLFFDWRFNADGTDNEDFELNKPEAKGASILIADHNFGCGSSREHAPWALQDYGFKVIISPSFADIFYNNCFKNGILPIRLPEETVYTLMENSKAEQNEITVDLENQTVKDQSGYQTSFEVDSYWKEMLLKGWDEISLTLQYGDDISAYEEKVQA
ncbi:3-isopropylmalate dehydratase small subunit [Bacillus sp. FJAT-44742]|uniref:3-isopropylmalate dehydratase small subunit n=1 Tax=Bacillus sp. FJAT-44742 TaxID=2014005 RepID=UPI000C2441F9|nr:3-isopropylmalate dehydratase small subunit [Bacillus sp. FJAT-44742]